MTAMNEQRLPRLAQVERKTNETDIKVDLNLDGTGQARIDTGVGFLNHMLELFTRHGGFDLEVTCKGDTWVDDHHSTEDVGIALGQAFDQALADRRGINRYASLMLPMDEALIRVAVDISGRDCLVYDLDIPSAKVGTFDTELVSEFWLGFVRQVRIALHIKKLEGVNSHHIIEGCFKGVARALREAVAIDERFASSVPSTKGVL